MDSLKGYFCKKPFETFEIGRDRELGPGTKTYACCPSWLPVDLGDPRRQDVDEIWNGPVLQKIRESIHDGSFRFCRKDLCPEIAMGVLPKVEMVKDPYLVDIIENKRTVVSKGPRVLNFANDRTCNIQCPSCRSELIVNNSGAAYEKAKELNDKVWHQSLKDLKLAIFSSTGDPFASKISRDQLVSLDGKQYPELDIKICTNGILLTPSMWDSMNRIHDNIKDVVISLDAASKDVYEITRKGGDFDKVIKNIEYLAQLKKEGKFKPRLKLDFVVQNENYFEMKEFVLLGKELGVDSVYFQRIVNWHTFPLWTFRKHAVWQERHPNYQHFISVLRDPIFDDPFVQMGNVFEFLKIARLEESSEETKEI